MGCLASTCSQMVQEKKFFVLFFCNFSGKLRCSKTVFMKSFTFFVVAPLFLVILICFALVCASGFFLFLRFLLSPGLLPVLSLLLLLLGEGGFLLCSLENGACGASLDTAMTLPTCDENGRKGPGSGNSLPNDRTRSWKMCSHLSLPGLFRPLGIPLSNPQYVSQQPSTYSPRERKSSKKLGS